MYSKEGVKVQQEERVMRVAVCDDEVLTCEQIKRLLLKCELKYRLELEIICFSTGEELLEAPFDYEILFLDICLNNGLDGIELGKELRKRGNIATFILCTFVATRHREGYKAGVHRYLEKPLKEKEFEEAFMSAVKMLCHNSTKIDIHYKTETKLIDASDILYIESCDRRRYVNLKSGEECFTWESLDRLESRLPGENFFRLHKGMLINLEHVKRCSKRELTMDDGRTMPIEKKKYDSFNMSLMRFLGGEE